MSNRIKIFSILSLFFVWFFVSSVAQAATDVTLSGFGTGGVDDVYINDGLINSRDSYSNGTYHVCWQGSHWQVDADNTTCNGGPSVMYYDATDQDVLQPCDVVTWSVGAGSSPAGSVDCAVEPPVATSTASTTLISDPNRDVFNGILLFVIGMVFTIWLIRK